MKPINQPEIKKQRIIFSLSLLSLVLTTALFVSAFFWSTNSEIEWTSSIQKEQAQIRGEISQLRTQLAVIDSLVEEYDKAANPASRTKIENRLESSIDSLVVRVPSNLKFLGTEFSDLDKAMRSNKTILDNYTAILANSGASDSKCEEEIKDLEDEIEELEKERDKYKEDLIMCKVSK